MCIIKVENKGNKKLFIVIYFIIKIGNKLFVNFYFKSNKN